MYTERDGVESVAFNFEEKKKMNEEEEPGIGEKEIKQDAVFPK